MKYFGHHHEHTPAPFRRLYAKRPASHHKVDVWNAFVDSDLTGINNDDCAIYPRILPLPYLKTIHKTAHDLTLFAMRLLSLPEREVRAILPSGPIRDFLIEELEVLRFHPQRLAGSFRFDMAIVGEPRPNNPPKLLELNEIGFGGLARSTFIEETLFKLIPGLKSKVFTIDAAACELQNMRRLAKSLTRIHCGDYDWEEELLVARAPAHDLKLDLVSPRLFGAGEDLKHYPLLPEKATRISNSRLVIGKDEKPDAIQMGFSFELNDYKSEKRFYQSLVRSKTPQYGPFITGLVASKMILVLLSDPLLRRKLLGSARILENVILPAHPLNKSLPETQANPDSWVLKHVDGLGGEMVFLGNEIPKRLKRIKARQLHEWIVQERTKLNTIDVNGILSRPKRVISDLGVLVQYDFSRGRFNHFGLGGTFTRATNKSYRVNVCSGGLQVPIMYQRP